MLGALALTFTPVFWQQWPQWESSGRPSCAICTRSLWPSSTIPWRASMVMWHLWKRTKAKSQDSSEATLHDVHIADAPILLKDWPQGVGWGVVSQVVYLQRDHGLWELNLGTANWAPETENLGRLQVGPGGCNSFLKFVLLEAPFLFVCHLPSACGCLEMLECLTQLCLSPELRLPENSLLIF